jgi:hypothetical protein
MNAMNEVSAAKAVAKEIAERMGARKLAVNMLRGLLETVLAGPRTAGRDLGPAFARLELLVDRTLIISTAVETLERLYDLDELVEILDFYRSSAGQSLLDFGVDKASKVSEVFRRWSVGSILMPALRSAGVSDEDMTELGLPKGLILVPPEWDGIDPLTREAALATLNAMGVPKRLDEFVVTQVTQLGPLVPVVSLEPFAVSAPKQLLLELLARMYCEAFSREALDAIRGFHETAIGRRTVELAPMIERTSAESIHAWLAANPGVLEAEFKEIIALYE